jgi:hypothetical protein
MAGGFPDGRFHDDRDSSLSQAEDPVKLEWSLFVISSTSALGSKNVESQPECHSKLASNSAFILDSSR